SGNVNVRAVDALGVQPVCDQGAALPLRVPTGTTVVFDGVLTGGGQKLAGYCPGAFAGAQVTCSPYLMDIQTDGIRCQWSAPAGGGSVDITSSLGPALTARLETYGPADVTTVTALLSQGTRTIG